MFLKKCIVVDLGNNNNKKTERNNEKKNDKEITSEKKKKEKNRCCLISEMIWKTRHQEAAKQLIAVRIFAAR
jgi:hypothetical protein